MVMILKNLTWAKAKQQPKGILSYTQNKIFERNEVID